MRIVREANSGTFVRNLHMIASNISQPRMLLTTELEAAPKRDYHGVIMFLRVIFWRIFGGRDPLASIRITSVVENLEKYFRLNSDYIETEIKTRNRFPRFKNAAFTQNARKTGESYWAVNQVRDPLISKPLRQNLFGKINDPINSITMIAWAAIACPLFQKTKGTAAAQLHTFIYNIEIIYINEANKHRMSPDEYVRNMLRLNRVGLN